LSSFGGLDDDTRQRLRRSLAPRIVVDALNFSAP
jgi:hypothetical protein